MPANVVKTPEDEKYWQRAKDQAAEAGHKEDWPYIMAIFQKTTGRTASSQLRLHLAALRMVQAALKETG